MFGFGEKLIISFSGFLTAVEPLYNWIGIAERVLEILDTALNINSLLFKVWSLRNHLGASVLTSVLVVCFGGSGGACFFLKLKMPNNCSPPQS